MGDRITLTTPSATLFEATPTIVRVKQLWADDWQVVPYLYATYAENRAAPGVSSAKLKYHYGNIQREGLTTFDSYYPLNLYNYYVQISVPLSGGEWPVWHGIIVDPSYTVHGTSSTLARGTQDFTAYGLEHLLDRIAIIGGWANQDGTIWEIDWSPKINERHSRGVSASQGNRDTTDPAFGPGGQDWTASDILNYVEDYYFPASPTFTYDINSDIQSALLDIKPRLQIEGLTIREVLNKVIDRKRGLGWCLRTDGTSIQIFLYSIASEWIGETEYALPPNAEIHDIAIDEGSVIQSATVDIMESRRYDKIRVQGERLQTCCSFSLNDGTLEAGWTDAEETAYKTAVGSDADVNDNYRATDRFIRVYQHVRVPIGFDWKVGDGVGGVADEDMYIAAPDTLPDGTIDITTTHNYYNKNKGFLSYLPFLSGYDYSASLTSPTGRNPTNSEPVHVRPFVICLYESGIYFHVEKPSEGITFKSRAHVTMVDREMAVLINSTPNHAFALGSWDDAAATNFEPGVDPGARSWEDMIVTAAIETDARLFVEVNVSDEFTYGDVLNTLVINIPDAHMWYVAPETVFGIQSDGSLWRVAAGGLIRDDSARVKAIASAARAWYSQRRSKLTLTLRGVQDLLAVGSMIKNASERWTETDIGTVVTRKRWNFGSKTGAGSTLIETDFGELDFTIFG